MKKSLLIFALISIFNIQFSTSMAQDGTLVDGVAAVGGKHIVKYSDIETAYAQARMRTGDADASQTRCDILENLILTQLLVHKGEIDSVEVSNDDVDQYVQYYLKGLLRQYGSKDGIRENTGLDYEELKSKLRREQFEKCELFKKQMQLADVMFKRYELSGEADDYVRKTIADGTSLYWKNSYGRIVITDGTAENIDFATPSTDAADLAMPPNPKLLSEGLQKLLMK